MEENTQLPKEVVNAVYMEAEEVYNKLDELAREACHVDFGLPMFHKVKQPIEVALTAYATKLHQVEEEYGQLKAEYIVQQGKVEELREVIKVLTSDNNRLKGEVEGLKGENEKLKAMSTGCRPLLEEVLKHDAAFGELSIEIIDKIKTFLYGE